MNHLIGNKSTLVKQFLYLIIYLFVLNSCSNHTESQKSNKELILGSWVGTNQEAKYTLEFTEKEVKINYNSSNVDVKPYHFVNDTIVEMGLEYECIITKLNEETLTFKPNTEKLLKFINVMYTVDFKRE